MHSLSEVLDIGRGQTSHGDTTVASHVDSVLLSKSINLSRGEAREAEHADLLGDVRPVASRAEFLESIDELSTHSDNTISHKLDLTAPLGTELRVAPDGGDDSGTMDGRVGVHRTNENLQLRFNGLLLGGIAGDDVKSTDTLTVETEVLGKRLRDQNLVTLLDEVANSPDITLRITGGEALVGGVKEDVVALALADLAGFLPLLFRGINTSGVVGAGVENHDGASRGSLNISQEARLIETDGLGIVVTVVLDLESSISEDGDVVAPSRLRNEDLAIRVLLRQEASQEVGSNTESTSTRKNLRADNLHKRAT